MVLYSVAIGEGAMFRRVGGGRYAGSVGLILMALVLTSPAARGQLIAEKVLVQQVPDQDAKGQEGPGHGSRTIYSLSDGSENGGGRAEHAELIVDRLGDPRLKTELRFNVWQGEQRSFRDDPALPIERRLAFFRPLMERFLSTEKPEAAYGLLFYGYRELYDRLPGLAARDPGGWDRRLGRTVATRQGYGYFEDLLTRDDAYRELAQAVGTLHYRVGVTGGLEELRVLPVAKLAEGQRKDLPPGLKATDLLPSRIAIDFTLTKER